MPEHIAILGATSHIAKGLIAGYAASGDVELTLYARNTEAVKDFLASQSGFSARIESDFETLPGAGHDIIVNCILSRETPHGYLSDIFATGEYFDNLLIRSLERNPGSLGVSLSSGAVFGGDFSSPVSAESMARLDINNITSRNFYQAVKLYSEAKHRALSHLNIVDTRIYAYFSRFIDPSTQFLMTDTVRAVRDGTVLVTDDIDIVRDYIHHDDLRKMIDVCIARKPINSAFDLYSISPVRKFELLNAIKEEFGLQFRVVKNEVENVKTGPKIAYYSTDRSAGEIGYRPTRTALETVLRETRLLLKEQARIQ